jgi:dolichyl-diphosphooligosaccharide--protein glycosyltransferase
MVTPSAVRDLLERRPDLEPAVAEVLATEEPFEFDDVELDSGRFGELVDADVLERTADGYVVTDRDAIRRGLTGEVDAPEDTQRVEVPLTTPPATVLATLAGAVGLVVLFRLVPLPNVFQDGAVVLSGNDPYYYRYWIEQLLVDPSASVTALPDAIATEEPLLVVTLWLLVELFGGTKPAAGTVMAWYPVASAVVTALLLYLLAVETTSDRRVGLASVVILAVIPGHAVRTSVGFADHHAFDVPWLVLTALALVVLVRGEPRVRLGAAGLAVGVAGQTLAWWASPLLLVPIGPVVLARAVLAWRADESPVDTLRATLAGLGGGAALVLVAHVGLGWHTTTVALTPALLLAGSVATVVLVAASRAYGLDRRVAVGGLVGAGLAGLGVVALILPGLRAEAVRAVTQQLFLTSDVGESRGLFTSGVGWLLWVGLVMGVAIPYMAWGTVASRTDARWTVPVVYGWFLLVLAAVQVRFLAELAPILALFAGLGVVHLAERIGVVRRPAPFGGADPIRAVSIPGGRQLGTLALLLFLVIGLSIVQVPIQAEKTATPHAQYETAAWMADYSESRGWTYPANYVFSPWGQTRMYNYFVNGESRSYGYARDRYSAFLESSTPAAFYEELRDRAGFVVYDATVGPGGDVGRALAAYGSRTDGAPGLSHYRAVHVSEESRFVVYVLVPGATLRGTAAADTTLAVESDRTLEGRRFGYERRVDTDADGRYAVTVPYPGRYSVNGTTVEVPEAAVSNGENVTVPG